MAQRRHHYERAFEHYLREKRIPYVAVDEARKALLPDGAALRVSYPDATNSQPATSALKSFDFVLYGSAGNALIDVKGRKVIRRTRQVSVESGLLPGKRPHGGSGKAGAIGAASGRLESWVTQEDIESLGIWQQLFGEGFFSAFVFVYWCDDQPPDGLFQEIMEFQGRWYALRAIKLDNYAPAMRVRSQRWRTVDLARKDFDQLSQPFVERWVHRGG